MPRELLGNVHIPGLDHETVVPNERKDLHKDIYVVLFENQPEEINLNIPDLRWGGECRVETRVGATLLENGKNSAPG